MRAHGADGSDAGAAAVEFAIIVPLVMMVVFMTLYGGLYVFYAVVADYVARTAVRDASIPTAQSYSPYPSDSDVVTAAQNAAGSLLPAPTSVQVASNPATSPPNEGDEVTVTVTYDLPAVADIAKVMWFLPAQPSSTVTRSAMARRE